MIAVWSAEHTSRLLDVVLSYASLGLIVAAGVWYLVVLFLRKPPWVKK